VRGVLCVWAGLSGHRRRCGLPGTAASVPASCGCESVDDGVEARGEAFVAVVDPDGFAEVDERGEAVGRQGLKERGTRATHAGNATACEAAREALSASSAARALGRDSTCRMLDVTGSGRRRRGMATLQSV
jgi:hypothetical protein